jgi:cytoskeletal protein RodZ
MASRRNDAQQAQRRKKLVLIGLMVVFAALLAFQLPKLLKGSGSSSSTATTSSTTSAAPSTSVTGTRSLTAAKTSVSTRRAHAIRGMAPKDLFVPLIQDSSTTASSPATASAPAPVTHPAASASAAPVVTKPAHVKPAVPTAAVIWTNGQRQVVGVSQVFKVGDAQFKLVAVTRDTIRIKAVGGAFSGRGAAITVQKGRRVTLANTATGVRYSLLFTQAGVAASSTAKQPAAISAN